MTFHEFHLLEKNCCFRSKIGIWNIISGTSSRDHQNFFQKISKSKFRKKFENFKMWEFENKEKMTFKIVIFGFNFCQKRQVKLIQEASQILTLIWFIIMKAQEPSLPFLTGNLKNSKFPEISWLFRRLTGPKMTMFHSKMPLSDRILWKNLTGKFQKCWHRFSTLCLIELQRRILLVILWRELIFLRMDSFHQYHWSLRFFW